MLEADSLPVNVNHKAIIPVVKKTDAAIRLLKLTIYVLPKRLKVVIGLRKIIILGILSERNIDISNSGVTIPKTYIPPTKSAPKKVGERKVKAITPTKTGAQQAEVMPEKIPKVKMDKTSVLPAIFAWGKEGIGSLIPKKVIVATSIITNPPKM